MVGGERGGAHLRRAAAAAKRVYASKDPSNPISSSTTSKRASGPEVAALASRSPDCSLKTSISSVIALA